MEKPFVAFVFQKAYKRLQNYDSFVLGYMYLSLLERTIYNERKKGGRGWRRVSIGKYTACT